MMFITIHYMKHSRATITDGKMNLHKIKSSHGVAFNKEKIFILLDAHQQDHSEILFLQEMANVFLQKKSLEKTVTAPPFVCISYTSLKN